MPNQPIVASILGLESVGGDFGEFTHMTSSELNNHGFQGDVIIQQIDGSKTGLGHFKIFSEEI